MELNDKTLEELKVIAYDLMAQSQALQNSLNMVNRTIAEKSNSSTTKPISKPEKTE